MPNASPPLEFTARLVGALSEADAIGRLAGEGVRPPKPRRLLIRQLVRREGVAICCGYLLLTGAGPFV